MFGLNQVERRTQLHFMDAGTLNFRNLDIEDTFLVEKDNNGEITRGWPHYYRNQFPFAGYKGIKAGQVTLSFDRDIILDPYGLIKDDVDNPDKAPEKTVMNIDTKSEKVSGVQSWLSSIGEARRLKMMANRGKDSNYNKLMYFLGAGLMLEFIIIGILSIGKI